MTVMTRELYAAAAAIAQLETATFRSRSASPDRYRMSFLRGRRRCTSRSTV